MACKKKSRQVQLLISNKVDIRAKVTRDREGHCIMMKVSVHQENSSLKVYISKTPPKTKSSHKIGEAKTARTERRKIHKHS